MKYTIKKLAKTSGVSTRTLRYYDQIKLLAPAYYADNGYRYYGEKELLRLQQILFFRELGFKLEDIKTIINANEFDQLYSLKKHKSHLIEKIKSFKSLIKTIDNTIAHLNGEIKMKDNELYLGFTDPKHIELMQHLASYMGNRSSNIIKQYVDKGVDVMQTQSLEQKQQTEKWCNAFKDAINKNLKPSSPQVQAIINEHYETRVKPFCDMTADEFVTLFIAEQDQPASKAKYNAVHPKMAGFVLAAVIQYSNSRKNIS